MGEMLLFVVVFHGRREAPHAAERARTGVGTHDGAFRTGRGVKRTSKTTNNRRTDKPNKRMKHYYKKKHFIGAIFAAAAAERSGRAHVRGCERGNHPPQVFAWDLQSAGVSKFQPVCVLSAHFLRKR